MLPKLGDFIMLYRVVLDIASAIIFLTRIPVAWHKLSSSSPNLSSSQWAFPIVGALVGLLVGSVTVLFLQFGLNLIPAACFGIMSGTLITEGLYEDGLADSVDGLGQCKTSDTKLEIMKDSSLGAYVTSAQFLTYFLRITLLASLGSSSIIIFACILTASGGRTSMVLLRRLSSPVSIKSSANTLDAAKVKETILSLVICSTFFLFFSLSFIIVGLLIVFGVPIFISWLTRKLTCHVARDFIN